MEYGNHDLYWKFLPFKGFTGRDPDFGTFGELPSFGEQSDVKRILLYGRMHQRRCVRRCRRKAAQIIPLRGGSLFQPRGVGKTVIWQGTCNDKPVVRQSKSLNGGMGGIHEYFRSEKSKLQKLLQVC